MKYPIAIERGNDEFAWGVIVPDVEGCYSAGDSYSHALEMAKEALELHFEGMAEDGETIPLPKAIEDYIDCEKFAGWLFSHIEIDIEPYLGKSKKINVSLPNLLRKKIDDVVLNHPEYDGRSEFLQIAALRELDRLKS